MLPGLKQILKEAVKKVQAPKKELDEFANLVEAVKWKPHQELLERLRKDCC